MGPRGVIITRGGVTCNAGRGRAITSNATHNQVYRTDGIAMQGSDGVTLDMLEGCYHMWRGRKWGG